MNFLGFNILISRRAPTQSAEPPVPQQKGMAVTPEAWLGGEDLGCLTLSNAYEQVVWVYRAINVLAEQVANVPFLFSHGVRGRENLITSGPLHEFYSHPHPHLNRFQYWELRIIWLMLRGECFRIPVFDTPDAPSSCSFPTPPPPTHARHSPQPATNPPIHPSTTPVVRRPALKSILILDPARFQHIVEDHQLIGWRYTGFGPDTPLASQVFLPEEVWFERLPNPFDFWRGMPPLYVAALAAQTDFAAASFMRGIIENNADTGVIVRTEKWLGQEQRAQILATLRERKRRAGCADKPTLLSGVAEVIKPQLSSSDLQFLENRKFSRAEICAAFGVPEEIVTTTDHAKYDVMAGARLNFIENRVAPLCARLEAAEEQTVRSIDPQASGWFDLDSLPILQETRKHRLAAARLGFEMGVPFNELNRVLELGFKPLPWGDRGYLAANLHPLVEPTSCPSPSEGGPGEPAPTDPRLESKLRRFLFEQRARVLAALEQAELSKLEATPLLEAPAEIERLVALLTPLHSDEALSARPSPLHLARELVGQTAARLQAHLAAGFEQGETRAALTARVKAFYNEAAAQNLLALRSAGLAGPVRPV